MSAVSVESILVTQGAKNVLELVQKLNEEAQAHATTIDLLRRLKAGEVDISDVIITDDGWRIVPKRPSND